MGFDTFGLWTENYAIEHKMKPQDVAKQNIETYKKQLEMFGTTYDRSRCVNTADPKYFKRTQRIFLQLYNHYYDDKLQKAMPITDPSKQERLAYVDYKPINRCPKCMTGLANEDLEDGKCERCGSVVEQKPMKQWVLRITKYAERLLAWLDDLKREESMKELERNRIGKSEGTEFKMKLFIPENETENAGEWMENTWKSKKKLSKENNDGTYDIIWLAMKVHKELGPWLQEKIYLKWLKKVLQDAWYKVETEKKIQYKIDGEIIGYWSIDILVNDTIAIELKSRKILEGDFYKQLRTYINQSENITCGLLINFYNGKLEYKRLERDYNIQKSSAALSNSQANSLEFWVYTTRIDTVFWMSFVAIAPEHPLVDKITTKEHKKEVEKYQEAAKHKTQLERTELQKDKTWIFCGAYAINPFNEQKVPIYVADYVLANYGTGVVMAVPAHDERDYEFAKKYKLPIQPVIYPKLSSQTQSPEEIEKELKKLIKEIDSHEVCYTEKWILVNSWEFSGLKSEDAIPKMNDRLKKKWIGGSKVNYKIQDRVFSRQRYRGEPFPILRDDAGNIVALDEKDLPLELPDVDNYEPTGTEEGPLAAIADRVNVTKDGKQYKRETNTMPSRAGSSRYRLRYMDVDNDKVLVGKDKEKYRGSVDVYVGGAEHITRHMIYARFWQKFLYDIGVVSHQEPFQEYHYVWLIMGEDGRKMSKRRGNVINPDDIVNQFGADVLRTYEMFMWPFEQSIAWNTAGISWTKKFLDKVQNLLDKVQDDFVLNDETKILLNQSIKKLTEDIDEFKFNTAISQLMILTNHLTDIWAVSRTTFETLVILLSPFAPHLAEELWEKLGNEYSLFTHAKRPSYDEKCLVADTISIGVQVNGKVRGTICIPQDADEKTAVKAAKADEKIANRITWTPKKIIYVKGKILNIVV